MDNPKANEWSNTMPPPPPPVGDCDPLRHFPAKKELESMSFRMAKFEAELLELKGMVAEALEAKAKKKG